MDFESTLKLAMAILAIIVFVKVKRPKHKIDRYDLALKAATSMHARTDNDKTLVLAELEAYLIEDISTNEANMIGQRDLNREQARGLIRLRPYTNIWKTEDLYHLDMPTLNLGKWQLSLRLLGVVFSLGTCSIFSFYQTIFMPLNPEVYANENPIAVVTLWFLFIATAIWSLSYTVSEIDGFILSKKLIRPYLLKK